MKITKNYEEREKAKNKYRELSEEEKNIKGEYRKKRYYNMSEENKKKLKEYQKHYREAKKHASLFSICVTWKFPILFKVAAYKRF